MSKPIETFEHNLRNLLTAVDRGRDSAAQTRLLGSVLAEVASHRRVRHGRFRVAAWAGISAAAAVLLLAIGLRLFWHHPKSDDLVSVPPPASRIGQVREFYGLVSLRNGEPKHPAQPAQAIHSGQWIETRWGSQAEILLDDHSRFLLAPCSLVQVDQKDMKQIQLKDGAFTAEVARQPSGKPLTIQTPAGQIEVLGTKLDVHVITRPNGRKQTRVSVTSGCVRMNAAGRDVRIFPNMEGIAEEGQPPITRSLTHEVNELIRLVRQAQPLAKEAGLPAGGAAIIDFNDDTSATVWQVVSMENRGQEPLRHYVLPLRTPADDVQVFTLQGGALATQRLDEGWQIDLSTCLVEPGAQAQVIVRVPGVQGLFCRAGADTFTFDRPAGASRALTLVQLRIPAAASITEVYPKPLETRETLSRLIVTIPAESQVLGVLHN